MDSRNIYTPDEFTKARHKELVMSLSEAELTAGCSPLKAIREKCIECAGGRAESLAKCNSAIYSKDGTNYNISQVNNIKIASGVSSVRCNLIYQAKWACN